MRPESAIGCISASGLIQAGGRLHGYMAGEGRGLYEGRLYGHKLVGYTAIQIQSAWSSVIPGICVLGFRLLAAHGLEIDEGSGYMRIFAAQGLIPGRGRFPEFVRNYFSGAGGAELGWVGQDYIQHSCFRGCSRAGVGQSYTCALLSSFTPCCPCAGFCGVLGRSPGLEHSIQSQIVSVNVSLTH